MLHLTREGLSRSQKKKTRGTPEKELFSVPDPRGTRRANQPKKNKEKSFDANDWYM